MTTVGDSSENGERKSSSWAERRKEQDPAMSSVHLKWAVTDRQTLDGIRYIAQPGQWRGKGEGEEQKKEHKQAPSLSHTRATAAGREPDFSWSFCLCFSSPLSENQEVKAPNLNVYLKYIQITYYTLYYI